MLNKYLGREDAPFGDKIWELLDGVVIGAAKSQLSGRRLLSIEGPYGLGLKNVPLEDQIISDLAVKVSAANSLPVSLIETTFTLGARDIATFEETGFPVEASEIAKAAISIAAAEDSIVFEGIKKLGIEGLLSAKGSQSVTLSSWAEVGNAANDIIKAVTTLDAAMFHGPYILALTPALYNLLYRLYPNGTKSEMDHIEEIIGTKVVKAMSISSGGVILASGKQFASIVIGQDLVTGFVGPNGTNYEFKITESIAPRIRVPEAICLLKGK